MIVLTITVRRKLRDDLQDQGENSCPNRVARLAKLAGIEAQIGYKRRSGTYSGKPSIAVDNTLDHQFDVTAPDTAWVTDISYIKTSEGFAYLAVIIDLYSRRIVGWLIQGRQTIWFCRPYSLPWGAGNQKIKCCSTPTKAPSSPASTGPHS